MSAVRMVFIDDDDGIRYMVIVGTASISHFHFSFFLDSILGHIRYRTRIYIYIYTLHHHNRP